MLNYLLQDCYKTIIDSICDLEATLYNDDSLWIDECIDSASGSSDLTVQEWELVAEFETDLLGGIEEDGAGCFVFAEWSDWAPYVAKMGHEYIVPMLGEKNTKNYY